MKNAMYNKEKKVLCSAEKDSVIWAEPNSRSSSEQFGQTECFVVHYFTNRFNSKKQNTTKVCVILLRQAIFIQVSIKTLKNIQVCILIQTISCQYFLFVLCLHITYVHHHYNLRLVHFNPTFWSPKTFISRGIFL